MAEAQPTNKNPLSPLGFRFFVKKLPTVDFFLQKVNIPGLQLSSVEIPNPFVSIPVGGDHIIFDSLDITFMVDEDMKNYIELFSWINGTGFPNDYSEYSDLANAPPGLGLKSDVVVSILTSAKNLNYEVTFRGAMPVSLTGLQLDTTLTDVQYLEAQASFRYLDYTIVRTI